MNFSFPGLVISSSDGHNDSNDPRLNRNDTWIEIGDILEALGILIPGRKRNKPDKEDIAGPIKETIKFTKDKEIKDYNTGKGGDPTEEKIVDTFTGNYRAYDVNNGDVQYRDSIIQTNDDNPKDSVIFRIFKNKVRRNDVNQSTGNWSESKWIKK